jgi:hypothetical protein
VTFEFLMNEAMLQPQVFVHRDFHSRNLMVLSQSSMNKSGPGVIDFQDALRGPIGYDLVSLLKDCYISWSRERVERWVKGYRRVLANLGANVGDSEYQFVRWFDLIGVQRHIKVLGIFCRLWHRDGKIGYLADLPLTFDYVIDACRRYPELVEFGRWLESRIAPLLPVANQRETLRAQTLAAAKQRRMARKAAKKSKRKHTPKRLAKRLPPKKGKAKRKPALKRTAKRLAKRRPVAKKKSARVKLTAKRPRSSARRAAKRRSTRRKPK